MVDSVVWADVSFDSLVGARLESEARLVVEGWVVKRREAGDFGAAVLAGIADGLAFAGVIEAEEE